MSDKIFDANPTNLYLSLSALSDKIKKQEEKKMGASHVSHIYLPVRSKSSVFKVTKDLSKDKNSIICDNPVVFDRPSDAELIEKLSYLKEKISPHVPKAPEPERPTLKLLSRIKEATEAEQDTQSEEEIQKDLEHLKKMIENINKKTGKED